ncbi:hypothetical protein EMIHUDRAFT_252747 [Emiliania huxleyi CCMP1516]|uniref:WH2 domain-containing protein n=2 Tax=Emiliania huxleyi TaxID=2903 RepID=A0A0D3KGC3_EMIH1|nr:hypothetical protein EMIHUDRAFT_252747 [Emiliania huxleyi CCMP1516]EOD34808.1 hypothetical protein EMIHUDRAFT_252747 [Emiliania huxleyi CCMP1516]|eukprot:XP_005787237.1 hypothetical protein EMIHUDRAFT_252747 [Emiliania huxleyi CCMP1516]
MGPTAVVRAPPLYPQVLKEGVLDDIAKGSGASLKSAGPAADRSAPLIAPDVEVKPSPMADLRKELAAVEASPALKHASADRSAPIIDGSVKVKPSPMPDLVEEIQKSPRSLNPRV